MSSPSPYSLLAPPLTSGYEATESVHSPLPRMNSLEASADLESETSNTCTGSYQSDFYWQQSPFLPADPGQSLSDTPAHQPPQHASQYTGSQATGLEAISLDRIHGTVSASPFGSNMVETFGAYMSQSPLQEYPRQISIEDLTSSESSIPKTFYTMSHTTQPALPVTTSVGNDSNYQNHWPASPDGSSDTDPAGQDCQAKVDEHLDGANTEQQGDQTSR